MNKKKVVSVPSKEKAMSPAQKKLEKREEAVHKDLDHDGEKGEPATHRAKVLGKKVGKK